MRGESSSQGGVVDTPGQVSYVNVHVTLVFGVASKFSETENPECRLQSGLNSILTSLRNMRKKLVAMTRGVRVVVGDFLVGRMANAYNLDMEMERLPCKGVIEIEMYGSL